MGRRTWSSSQIKSSISLTFGREAPCRHAAGAAVAVAEYPISLRDVSSIMASQNTRTRQAMQEETRDAKQTHG